MPLELWAVVAQSVVTGCGNEGQNFPFYNIISHKGYVSEESEPECEVDDSFSSGTEAWNAWTFAATPLHVFMAGCAKEQFLPDF